MYAIVTGGTKGIGRAVIEEYASYGYNICLCARNEVELYKTVADLQTSYPSITVKARPADLSDKAAVQDFGRWILELGIGIDVLVNNAGTFLPGNISEEEDGVFEKMMDLNIASAYHLTRMLLPKMISIAQGHIFNICSIASLHAYPNGGSYSISKYALKGFSDNLRNELREKGIKVTAVFPGAVYTSSWAGSGVPETRIMETKDIAKMMFAASSLSAKACVEEIVIRPQLGDLP